MEHIQDFKGFILNESESTSNIIIDTYIKILNQLTNLKDIDTLFELVEGNHLFEGVIENRELIGKAYNEFHSNLLTSWVSRMTETRLRSGDSSMEDIHNFSDRFKEWISNKGYDSQYVYLSYIPGTSGLEYTDLGSEEGLGAFPQVDLDDLDRSISKIVSAIKSNDVYNYYRGYFRMGFDVFSREEDEKPGWALFAFKDFSYKKEIEEADLSYLEDLKSLRPGDEDPYIMKTYFSPNSSLFYNFNPGGPYGRGRDGIARNPMVDFCDEEGFTIFSK